MYRSLELNKITQVQLRQVFWSMTFVLSTHFEISLSLPLSHGVMHSVEW